jgi:hypothetical protein
LEEPHYYFTVVFPAATVGWQKMNRPIDRVHFQLVAEKEMRLLVTTPAAPDQI